MNDKYKIIAIVGKSASGKDTIARKLVDMLCGNWVVSATTRPPRDYEENGKDYHFMEVQDFVKKIYDGSMLEATVFNDWGYGTPIDSLNIDKINVGVFNPEGILKLVDDERIDLFIIYLHADDKVRLIRSLNREENPDVDEIIRRYEVDKKDFYYFDQELENSNIKCFVMSTNGELYPQSYAFLKSVEFIQNFWS